jgi:glycerol-3-phosphate dehydrogenase
MARTVEDFLARRRRVLFLNARLAIAMAPAVAKLMAKLLKKRGRWRTQQVTSFEETAKKYIVGMELLQ